MASGLFCVQTKARRCKRENEIQEFTCFQEKVRWRQSNARERNWRKH